MLDGDIPFYPVLVVGDVFSIQQLIRRRVLPQFVFWRWTRVHEGLSYHRQAGVCDAVLVDVKYKLWVFDHIHPEPQRKTGRIDRKQWWEEELQSVSGRAMKITAVNQFTLKKHSQYGTTRNQIFPVTHCHSMLVLTSYFSKCAVRQSLIWSVCLPAHPGSQTCTWWQEAERCLCVLCWRWSQTSHPQTFGVYPEEENQHFVSSLMKLVYFSVQCLEQCLYTGYAVANARNWKRCTWVLCHSSHSTPMNIWAIVPACSSWL